MTNEKYNKVKCNCTSLKNNELIINIPDNKYCLARGQRVVSIVIGQSNVV